MKKKTLYLLPILGILASISLAAPLFGKPADTSIFRIQNSMEIIHFVSNSIVIKSPFFSSSQLEISFCVLISGLATLFAFLHVQSSIIRAATLVISLLIIQILFFGNDILAWRFIAATSCLFASALLIPFRKTYSVGLLCIPLILAPQLTCIAALSTFLLLDFVLGQKLFKTQRAFILTVALATWTVSLFSTPYSFPSYPDGARVVVDDGIAGVVRPMVGQAPTIPTVNRDAIRSKIKVSTAILLCLAFFTALAAKKDSLSIKILFISIFIDILLPEQFSLIGPIATLERVIPGQSVVSVTILLLALLPYVLTVSLVSLPVAEKKTKYIMFGTLILTTLTGLMFPYTVGTVPQMRQSEAPFLSSLSLPVYQYYGTELVKNYREIGTFPRTLLPFHAYDLATHSDLPNLNDGDEKTRWSQTPHIAGEGGIVMNLEAPTIIHGIVLNPGMFVTDFPGSIRIEGKKRCKEINWQTLTIINHWLGPVEFTKEGHPYFGKEDNVIIPLSSLQEIECLQIKQLSPRPPYDWSVAEITLF